MAQRILLEGFLRSIHGDHAVDAYLDDIDAKEAARAAASDQAWIMAYRAAVDAGDWRTVLRMDNH